MAKISLGLLFALVVAVPLHSVLCDEDPWISVLNEAKNEAAKAGLSQDTIYEAQKVIGDGTAKKVAEDALGGSLNDWVQQANDVANGGGSAPSGLPIDSTPDDEDEDNLSEAPESTPTAPTQSPTAAPTKAPTSAPTQAPSAAPQAQTPSSATI